MPVRLGLPVRLGPLLRSIRFRTNQRSGPAAEKLNPNTAAARSLSESDVNMIPGTDLNPKADATRQATVTLPPKRRSKSVCETSVSEALSIPPCFSRRPRMKRSGSMSLRLRSESNEQPDAVRISPETLSTFNRSIGALEKSPPKQPARKVA